MPLISLPLEILQQIADIVKSEHRPSLYTLSLTNSACHRAVVPLIFHHIQINVSHPEILQKDIAGLNGALSRTEAARHVQRISIKGDIRVRAQNTDTDVPIADKTEPPDGVEEILGNDTKTGLRHFVVYDESVIVKSSDEDMAWAPVVNLLQAVPYLRDLIYDCKSQFPPSLLEFLHQQRPRCRLHHLTFRFRTLLWGIPYPYEMELATSPSLYKLHVDSAWRDSDGDDDFNLEAVMDLASGLAPNLKEVSIARLWPIGCWRNDLRRREPWQGLPGLTDKVGGSLTSWTWVGRDDMVAPSLRTNWRKNIDLTHLQHLNIERFHESSLGVSGEEMQWIAQNRSFPQLKTLSVAVTRNDLYEDRPNYVENAVSFFQAFRPLEELSVYGPNDTQIIEAIFSQHGNALRKLIIHPDERWFTGIHGRNATNPPMELTKEHFSQIAVLCPLLEELSVPVRRNGSCASEVELYRCFGKMKHLRDLFLILDCSDRRVYVGDNQSSTPSIIGDEEKKILINYAVDESLARSIWNTISQTKEGRQLERLKLWPKGLDYGRVWGFFTVLVEEVSRSWLLERNPRDDHVDPLVRELGKLSREYRQVHWHWKNDFKWKAEELFRSIWPCKEGSKDWRDDWSSFPLEV
ncbi:hypothetical protein C7974DRAFT_313076 [Boeremia exigua]|uniref:uncharacterized protein n=1 Tax=Boeremia exigua TaxID=749465 RepID=UPI001E8D5E1F|nr:uncharacterized protein C7974DRAFT_313076 [Boeremia exigua]KAH6625399.1 hypothetical protein C7974DRAFT_313076 [Boeremia exigua]